MDKEKATSIAKSYEGIIGIDLGTTNSLVTFVRNDSTRIIPNERGDRMTPSVVYFRENGTVVVGEMAKTQAVLNTERTVRNVKLRMGKDADYSIGSDNYTAVDISSLILKQLKVSAERYLGKVVKEAVVTVPAYFDDRQREDTLKAAEKAGLRVRKLLNEPTAAALTYGLSRRSNHHLLVIDLGGGTFDITLMEFIDRVFRVRGVGGSTSIGGNDFDQKIVEYVLDDFKNRHGIDLTADRIAYQQIVIHAEKAKKDLSSVEETSIMVPYITATDNGPIHVNMKLTRTAFEGLIRPILDEIRSLIQQTFKQAGLTPEWVEEAIMVGGSTRVPAVEQLVGDLLGPTVKTTSGLSTEIEGPALDGRIRKNINPDEAVARGAGIMAGILAGMMTGIGFHDITPHDLGIEDDSGLFVTLLPRGTIYPVEAAQLFTTTEDYQPEVCIHVMQRTGIDPERLISLGWFYLEVDASKGKGEVNIDVTFAIDGDGRLQVTAIDIDSGAHQQITIRKYKLFNEWQKPDNKVSGGKIVNFENHMDKRRK